ncbi:MAG: MFS transporter [Anaerolineales bacterium]|nr:MFS transporter [Anaerolineales bacterium]
MSVKNILVAIRNNALILPLYLPGLLTAIVEGISNPTLPLYARELGAAYAAVGLILAGRPLGMLLAALPGGMILRAFGQKQTMIGGLVATIVAYIAMFTANSVVTALLCQLLAGVGIAIFGIARHAYITTHVSVGTRGRAVALYGGINRTGLFIGPTIGGLVAATYGLHVPFALMGLFCVAALLAVWLWVPLDTPEKRPSDERLSDYVQQLVGTMAEHRTILTTAGLGQLMAQGIRATRRAIIPLYAAEVLGLDVAAVGLLDSISSAIDMSMFYPAGMIMDRLGRKFAVVPSFFFQGLGVALIPLTTGFWSLTAVASFIGLANGLSSGTMLTIGADLAPQEGRSEFLGLWRLIGDMGGTVGPLFVGIVAGWFALPVAAVVMSSTGFLAAGIFGRFVPETLQREGKTAVLLPPFLTRIRKNTERE